ncbi:MAG TPA: PQQ-dependent sugar dehydrogenase [Calditrichia bacterium]|nr:PQQ-dependent sugar dehydrogenase [Calditrichia bacterium]HQV32208.1 PQQ-dependent sugar dehydrogenase [Calditrichia bacterium]
MFFFKRFPHWLGFLTLLASPYALAQFALQEAFPNLSFVQPVDIQNAGDGSNRLFVIEKRGRILVFNNDEQVSDVDTLLDIRSRVDASSSEEGLLGLAFHPDFSQNRYFFVNYTAASPNRSVIARYRVSDSDPNYASPDSELVIITLDKPFTNHNAGQLAFSPVDGYLYLSAGDGGDGGDPLNNGQNRQTLLGSMLRLDVNNASLAEPYRIPPDNPFVGNSEGFREEIWAYGLRNTWRFSFDAQRGWLWAGDVGQSALEEIDILENGGNYGWRIMEANQCYPPGSSCDTSGLKLPIWQYARNLGQSITGGHVYYGPSVPALNGRYIYADYVTGRMWSLAYDGVNPPDNTLLLQAGFNISTFGVDESGELFLAAYSFNGGRTGIYRFEPTSVGLVEPPGPAVRDFQLLPNYPNPFNPATRIPYRLIRPATVEIGIYGANGNRVRSLVSGAKGAGTYTAVWDGRNDEGVSQASGVYFYQLRVDGTAVDSRRMLLIK